MNGTKIKTSSQTFVHSLSHPLTQTTAFLCNSEDEQIFELSLSLKNTASMLTLPGTSKLEQNIKITNVGGLIFHIFFWGGGLKPLCIKRFFFIGHDIIMVDDILIRHQASTKGHTLLCLEDNGIVSSPSTI